VSLSPKKSGIVFAAERRVFLLQEILSENREATKDEDAELERLADKIAFTPSKTLPEQRAQQALAADLSALIKAGLATQADMARLRATMVSHQVRLGHSRVK